MDACLLKNISLEKVCWRITRNCNLSCPYCLAGYGNVYHRDLYFDEVVRILDILKAEGTSYITFTGGEPLLRHDFKNILEEASQRLFKIAVTTNGVLLSDDMIDVFLDTLYKVKVSLDGTKEIHNKLRHTDTFEYVFKKILLLIQKGVPVEINYPLLSENIGCIDEACDLFKDFPFDRINFILPMYRERMTLNQHLLPTVSHLAIAKAKILKIRTRMPFDVAIKNYYSEAYTPPILETDGTLWKSMFVETQDRYYGNILSYKLVSEEEGIG